MRKPHKTVVLTVGAGVVLLAVSIFILGGATERDIEAIKATGVPVNWQEFSKLSLGDGKDAQPAYERFARNFYHLPADTQSAQYLLANRSVIFEPRENREKATNKLRAAYSDFISASKLPTWRIGSTNVTLATYIQVNDLCRAAPYEMARSEAESGNWKDALALLSAMGRFNAQVEQNPAYTLFHAPNRMYQIYGELIVTKQHDAEALDGVIASLEQIPKEPDRRYYLSRYVVSDVQMFENSAHYAETVPTDSLSGKFTSRFLQPKKVRAFASKEIHMWRQALDQFPKGPLDWRTARDVLNSIYQQNVTQDDEENQIYSSAIAAAIKQCSVWGQTEALRKGTLMEAKLYQIRLRTGSFPKTLPVGDDAIDPFTDQPFVYRTTKVGNTFLMCGSQRIDLRPDFSDSVPNIPAHAGVFTKP